MCTSWIFVCLFYVVQKEKSEWFSVLRQQNGQILFFVTQTDFHPPYYRLIHVTVARSTRHFKCLTETGAFLTCLGSCSFSRSADVPQNFNVMSITMVCALYVLDWNWPNNYLLIYYWALWAILTHRYSLENIKPHVYIFYNSVDVCLSLYGYELSETENISVTLLYLKSVLFVP